MAYVSKLHQVQYTDCVEVCPVDCFYEGENMLGSAPTNASIAAMRCGGDRQWLDLNRKYSAVWPNITAKKAAMPNADEENGKQGKLAELSPHRAVSEVPV